MRVTSSSVEISYSTFVSNSTSNHGGVLELLYDSSLLILHSTFEDNTAIVSGGALYLQDSSNGTVINGTFQSNRADETGGAITVQDNSDIIVTGSNFNRNSAGLGGALAAKKSSVIYFDSYFINNQPVLRTISSGGASQIYNNTAVSGGGVYLSESQLIFGGVQMTTLLENQASTLGGGVHAEDSSIMFKSTAVYFTDNEATKGRGISLENSKFYSDNVKMNDSIVSIAEVNFVSNSAADHGGAIYVNDELQSENPTCDSDPNTGGCFFQNITNHLEIVFVNNSADTSGQNLFGELLDRCSVISATTPSVLEVNGAARFKEITNVENFDTVSSQPVRVCFCENNIPDCSQRTYSIQLRKGERFSIPVAAVDQVNQTVRANVQSEFKDVSLSDSQTLRSVSGMNCSNLDYQVLFPSVPQVYGLLLYAEGPCDNMDISRLKVTIQVNECLCPPGFRPVNTNSECICGCDSQDKTFSQYIQECDPVNETVTRLGRFWIIYLCDSGNDSTSPYFIHPLILPSRLLPAP